MKVGYIRVSTDEQNTARQYEALAAHGVEQVFEEKKSGKNTDREQLKAMLSFVRAGDTVVVESISRIARNTRDLLDIVEQLTTKGVDFVSLAEQFDSKTPSGRCMLTMFGAMAQLEREYILQRQKEGIAIAKKEGKYKGRKPIEIDETAFKDICDRWRAGELTAVAAADLAGLTKSTFYRRVNKLGFKEV